jgi:DNA primase
MDLLMSHQAGIGNTVASSGTALTHEQLEILKRLSNNVVIAYDSDSAGEAATARGWQIALGLGMNIKIATFVGSKDPADLILEDSEKFKNSIKNARHIIDVELDRIIALNLPDKERKMTVEKMLMPYVADLLSISEQSHYVSEIAFRSGMKEDIVWQILKKIPRNRVENTTIQSTSVGSKIDRKQSLSRMVAAALVWSSLKKEASNIDIREKICNIIGEKVVSGIERDFESLSGDLAFEAELVFVGSDSYVTQIEEIANNLKEELLREEFEKVMRDLHEAERSKDIKKAEELLRRCQELSVQLRTITKHT